MKRIPLTLLALALAAPLAQAAKSKPLTVQKLSQAHYRCAGGKTLDVGYYQLSDDSLGFARFSVDGKRYTLPQALSASGVRYSDDGLLQWWSKGDTGRLERRDDNGEYRAWFDDCRS